MVERFTPISLYPPLVPATDALTGLATDPIFSANVTARVRRRLHALLERTRYRLGLPEPDPGRAAIAGGFRHPVEAQQRESLTAQYRALFPDNAKTELAEAARLAAHSFSFLGHPVEHGDRIAWSRDPVSGRDWSRGFSPLIAYRGSARLGDIKLPWELNKHQYFFTLGKAAWLTANAAPAVEIVRQIDHWIADNPYRRGINWISALEAGTRVVSWILSYPFYADQCDDGFLRRFTRSIAQHMMFVEGHLSVGRFANNHLVGDSAALVAGGLFLDHRHSRAWIEKGIAHLEAQAQHQVTSDGVHAERSISYHRFVLDQYHLVNRLLTLNGRSFSDSTRASMERMTEFLMDAVAPDGRSPSIGDGDDARGIWFRADCTADFRSPLSLGAVLFERPDFKAIAGAATEEVFWLLGPEGVRRFEALPARLPDHTSAAYVDGGYFVMREGWEPSDAVLIFDCGPVGHGLAGHGHADTLSVHLHAAGYPFLVDPGAFSYNLDYDWRHAFRSTRAHNTIAIDGEDQSIPADRMSWSQMAQARQHQWLSTGLFDVADGEHDGYRRLADPVTHRRVVLYMKPDVWVICDVLSGQGSHQAELLFHLRPDCEPQSTEHAGDLILRAPHGAGLWISILGDGGEPVVPALLTGTDTERAAWFSPGYGTRIPSRALSARRAFVGRSVLTTCLSSSAARPRAVHEQGALTVNVRRTSNEEETLDYRTGDASAATLSGIHCDGDLVFARHRAGVPQTVYARRFRRLSLAKDLDLRADAAIDRLEFTEDRCDILADRSVADRLQIDSREGVTVVVNGEVQRRGVNR